MKKTLKKSLIILVMMLVTLILWTGKVSAAVTTSMSATNTSPEIGANVTITVRFSQPLATADFSLTYDSSKLQYVSNNIGGTNTGSSVVVGYIDFPALTTRSSATFTFKAKAEGVSNCSVVWASATDSKANEFDPKKGQIIGSSISINVKSKTTPTKPDTKPNTNTDNGTTTKPSTDTKPTFSGGSQKVYAKETVSIRDSWSTSGKLLGTLQKGASITRTGIGSNGWDRVTYNGRTAYISHTYLTTTKPKDDKDEDKDKNNTTNEVSNNTTNNEITNNTVNNETTNNQTNDVTNSETNEATNTQTQGNIEKDDKKGFSVNTIEIIIISVIILAIIVIIINEILAKKREEKRREARKRDEKRVKGSRR